MLENARSREFAPAVPAFKNFNHAFNLFAEGISDAALRPPPTSHGTYVYDLPATQCSGDDTEFFRTQVQAKYMDTADLRPQTEGRGRAGAAAGQSDGR